MACGYGACYGCVLPRNGVVRPALHRGPGARRRRRSSARAMAIPLLNASGCLDALTAPDVARSLDVFVTKTITPLPAGGQPTRPNRGDRARDARTRSACRGRGSTPSSTTTCRASPARRPSLGLRGRLLDGGLRALLRATRRRRPRGGDRAQPLVPERRGGAGDRSGARRRGPRGHVEGAVREALACAMGRRRVGPGGGRVGRRRAVARQHDPRSGGRSGHAARRGSRARSAATRGQGCEPIALACVHACAEAVDVPIVGMGGVSCGPRRPRARRGGSERRRARDGALRRPARARAVSGASWRRRSRARGSADVPGERMPLLSEIEKNLQTSKNSTA